VTHVLQSPVFTTGLPQVNVTEGETVRSAFNLFDFVADADTPKTSLIFSVADITNNNISVDMDTNQNVNVYSKGGWFGNATVKMKVSDGELSAYASFNVQVEHVAQPPPANQPPVMSTLPPLQLMEATQMERAFNIRNFTSDPDTPLANITFRIEEITEPKVGVSIDADGWVSIRPDRKWSGISFIVVNASDGKLSAKSSFTVTVTAKPVAPVTESNGTLLMAVYGLLALVMVLLVVVAMDIMVRTRKKRPGPPHEPAGAAAAAPKVVSPPPAKEGEVPQIPGKDAGREPTLVQPSEGTTGAASPQELYGTVSEAPAVGGAEAPSVPVVEVTGENLAPAELVGPQEPAVSVPDMTPPQDVGYGQYASPTGSEAPAATEQQAQTAGDASQGFQAEPPTLPGYESGAGQDGAAGQGAPGDQTPEFQMEPAEAGAPTAEAGPPAEQAPQEGAQQEHPGKSAALLLAQLQRAKTTADGMESGQGPQAPADQLEAASQSPEGIATSQPPIEAPATEIDAQDATTDGSQPAEEDQTAPKPVTRVRCAGCKTAIPVFSAQRPLVVTCPQCGRMGMLK
jgi:hypothetical protein